MMDSENRTSEFSLKLILFLIGTWWALFTIPAAFYLRPRPGPPLPLKHTGSWTAYLTHSWTLLFRTMLKAKQLRDITIFLSAWFLLSDALATVSGTAILFAKSELGMAAPALGAISVIVTLFGILGAFAWPPLATYLHLTPLQTLATCIALFELIPLYGLLGYIPFLKSRQILGLQQDWEMYPVGALYGLVLGGVGAYARAIYSELIPPGSEAAFYALYAITDKGSSIFGPAIVGAITDRWGRFLSSAVRSIGTGPVEVVTGISLSPAGGTMLSSVGGSSRASIAGGGSEPQRTPEMLRTLPRSPGLAKGASARASSSTEG